MLNMGLAHSFKLRVKGETSMLRGLLVEGFREFSGVTGVQDHAMDGLK